MRKSLCIIGLCGSLVILNGCSKVAAEIEDGYKNVQQLKVLSSNGVDILNKYINNSIEEQSDVTHSYELPVVDERVPLAGISNSGFTQTVSYEVIDEAPPFIGSEKSENVDASGNINSSDDKYNRFDETNNGLINVDTAYFTVDEAVFTDRSVASGEEVKEFVMNTNCCVLVHAQDSVYYNYGAVTEGSTEVAVTVGGLNVKCFKQLYPVKCLITLYTENGVVRSNLERNSINAKDAPMYIEGNQQYNVQHLKDARDSNKILGYIFTKKG